MNYKYTSISRTGLIRANNEDSIGVFKTGEGILAVVCDGVGGNKAGEVASQLTVDVIYNYFKESGSSDYLERIRSSITEANKAVFKKAAGDRDLSGMATTVETLFLIDNTAFCGHVGDSRVYLYSNKKIKQITKDHSYVQKLIDEGRITPEDAEEHPGRNIITRALGDETSIEVDLFKLDLTPGEKICFLVCTDGVTGTISNDELELIFQSGDINIISQKISGLVEERGAPDNYSFVLMGID
jgi:PPM family protein phosphatase